MVNVGDAVDARSLFTCTLPIYVTPLKIQEEADADAAEAAAMARSHGQSNHGWLAPLHDMFHRFACDKRGDFSNKSGDTRELVGNLIFVVFHNNQ